MPTSAEVLVGANRHCPMPLFESDDRDLCLLKNAVDHPRSGKAQSAGNDDPCFNGGRSADPRRRRCAERSKELLEIRLPKDDRDERGRVDYHAPSGP